MIHSVFKTRVRYAETDRMDVVHHSNYLIWFEAARIQMLDEIDLPYKQMEADGFLIPVLSAQLDYKQPAFFDDRLEIHLTMPKLPRARFFFDYTVRRGDQLLATGQTTHGFMNSGGRGMRPPAPFLERIEAAWEAGKAIG
ncbi:MAG: acyl-CoA thioesterase [Opitutales bacterium]